MTDTQFEFIDQEKEIAGEEYDSAESQPEESVEAQSSPEVDVAETEAKAETPEPFAKVGEQSFESVEDLVKFAEDKDKSYQNAQQLIGRQGNELGELRTSVDKLNENLQPKQEEKPAPELDPYDADSVRQYLSYERNQIKKDVMDSLDKKRRVERVQEARKQEVEQFVKTNPDLSQDDLAAIAKYGDERGVNLFEDAHRLMKYEGIQKKLDAIEKGKDVNKVAEASKLPNTLSGISGSNKEGVDFDNLSAEQWAKLPQDVRMKALMDAPQ